MIRTVILPVLDEIASKISLGVTIALANEVQLHVSVMDRYEEKQDTNYNEKFCISCLVAPPKNGARKQETRRTKKIQKRKQTHLARSCRSALITASTLLEKSLLSGLIFSRLISAPSRLLTPNNVLMIAGLTLRPIHINKS